jgi:chemotaxis response regulator CheB
MQKKVLIVDDSALMRRVLSDIINMDERFQVSKVATNGLEAFDLLSREKGQFDAILLDINMPKMNGLELLEQLEKYHIKATVIIVSTVAKEGAKETIRALELGAFDFVTKPESFFDVKSDKFKNNIIDCLVVATKLYLDTKSSIVEETFKKINNPVEAKKQIVIQTKKEDRPLRRTTNGKRLIALACSTGGPKALQQVIPLLTENIGCSVLIVQHMPEGFTASLANRLNEMSKIEVKEASDGDILRDGVAYIAKGGSQMRLVSTLGGAKLVLSTEPARNGLKPCADIMYESLIQSEYDEIICVVLTGMGGDGTIGIKQLKDNKNIYVIAQDEATSTVYGMPKVVAEAGLVNEVVPLGQIASAIQKNLGVH